MHRIETLDALAALLDADLSCYDVLDRKIDHAGIRLGSAMRQMTEAIRAGDRPAARIAHALLMKDPHLPFGKLIKSDIARAFKQRVDLLSEREKEQLAGKTSMLLGLPFCPREVEDYCRLLRRMESGFAERTSALAKPINPKARTLAAYLATPREKS